ncbi:MAG: hypothetical protein KKA54_07785 [Proteobacteria bacterium]|nr:hypothetical protein [Pseudomonadota bacterium]
MGNFSRNTFDRLKHYVGVRLQQGVPLIDADWNEQEDIRKFELQAFLKWFAGNGVPSGSDGFLIMAAAATTNNFDIKGGNGTALGAGRILVEGMDAMLESTMRYSNQPLYNNPSLAAKWGVTPIAPLTTPGAARIDLVYIDVWEREVDSSEDTNLINPAIGIESCVRLRREWAVRVAQGAATLPAPPAGHGYYTLARIKRPAGNTAILAAQIEDLRTKGINLADLAAEIIDARGMKGNVGNRLDESLTKGGQLRFNVVGNDQVQAAAAINESKILFNATGHDHSGGAAGNTIGTNGLENFAVTNNKLADLSVTSAKISNNTVTAAKISDNAVTTTKIADDAVRRDKLDLTILNNGTIVDLSPGTYELELVQANVTWQDGLKRIYMPVVAITSVTGTGTADIRHEFVYRSISGRDTYDVYIRISNEAGGSEKVDIYWYVYIFAEN